MQKSGRCNNNNSNNTAIKPHTQPHTSFHSTQDVSGSVKCEPTLCRRMGRRSASLRRGCATRQESATVSARRPAPSPPSSWTPVLVYLGTSASMLCLVSLLLSAALSSVWGCVGVCVGVCVCVGVYMGVHVYIYICVCVCVHGCACIYICVCV